MQLFPAPPPKTNRNTIDLRLRPPLMDFNSKKYGAGKSRAVFFGLWKNSGGRWASA
jgi:hypothetical protein